MIKHREKSGVRSQEWRSRSRGSRGAEGAGKTGINEKLLPTTNNQ
jgi:hypothetical protein